MLPRPLFLLLVSSLTLASPFAAAQVRRCTGADGATVFTDRQCADLGKVERVPHASALSGSRAYRGGCARTVRDLVFEMTSAFDAHDANRLAGVYHWAGLAGDNAYAVLARLDALVQRPLVDIVPVMPSPPQEPLQVPVDGFDAATVENGSGGSAIAQTDGNYYPQASVRQTPVALRVEQTLVNGTTPSRTVFGLRKHFGCWWLQF